VGTFAAYSTEARPLAGRDLELLTEVGDQLSAQLQASEAGGSARTVASAELLAMRAQLEPHFVFNCLNTIASFIRTDPVRARELVLAFADYCRAALANPADLVTLAVELGHVRSYLALERARFGERLQADIEADEEALAVRLPPFLVQPLVENAVKHGSTDRPLHVVVRAHVRDGRLRITVRDDGRGIARELMERVLEPGVGSGNGAGLGLSQVHRRLAALYGGGVRLRSGVFGTVVRLDVPA
jgi:LytS/YehU family sensor histidine kinase